jgi:hypothetical protein
MKTFGVVSPEPLDSLLLAALKHSPLGVVSLASSQLSNWWLAAHLADLLQLSDSLHTQPELASSLSSRSIELFIQTLEVTLVHG